MSSTLRQPMTIDAFLAWETGQELRDEFDGVVPVAVNGGSLAHEWLCGRLLAGLHARLDGAPCWAFGATAKVVVDGRVRYPDASITCTKQDFAQTVVAEPVAVFEVVSLGSEHTDRFLKFREYRRTASIQRYVIIEQTSIGALVFSRRGDLWAADAVSAGGTIAIPDAAIGFAIDELYAGLDMPPLHNDHDAPPA